MRSYAGGAILLCLVALITAGCGGNGGGLGTLSLKATQIESDQDVDCVLFSIDKISLSETGETWTVIAEGMNDIIILANAEIYLEEMELPVGEYHGVKIELSAGVLYTLYDGETIHKNYPDILLYRVPSDMYRYSNSGNGFPDTNQYWMFTTRNEAISSPVVVEPNETSFLVFSFRPMYQLDTSEDVGLAASCSYTSFLY